MDDEKVLDSVDFTDFEDKFKTLGRNSIYKGSPSTPTKSVKSSGEDSHQAKEEEEPTMLDKKRIQNVAIARKKVAATTEELRKHIAQ